MLMSKKENLFVRKNVSLCPKNRISTSPKPIACFSKSFTATEQAWSTFERELCGLKESMLAVDHLVKGFPLTVYTDLLLHCEL